jgi:hypothetical protein
LYLVGSSTLVRTEHDDIRRGVGELLSMKLLVILKELHVGTTADQRVLPSNRLANRLGQRKRRSHTLQLDLILDDKSLALVVNLLGEFGRNGMVSGSVLHHQTLIPFNALEDGGLFNRPLADVGPVLIRLGVLLFGVGWSPSAIPVISKLLQERSFYGGRLW